MNQSSLHRVIRDAWRIAISTPSLWFYALVASAAIWYGAWTGAFRGIWMLSQFNLFGDQILELYRQNAWQTLLTEPLANAFTDATIKPLAISIVLIVIAFIVYIIVSAQLYLLELIDSETGANPFNRKRHLKHPFIHPALNATVATHLLFRFVSIIVFMLCALPTALAVISGSQASVIISVVVFFLLFLPAALMVEAWKNFSIVSGVVERSNFAVSLKRGWVAVKESPLVAAEIGVVLIAMRLALSLLVVLLAGVLAAPTMVAILIFINSGMYIIASLIIFLLIVVIAAGVFILVSIYTTFDQSLWLISYKHLAAEQPLGKLLSVIEFIVEKGAAGMHAMRSRYQSSREAVSENIPDARQAEKLINEFIYMMKKKSVAAKPSLDSIEKELRKYLKQGQKDVIPKMKEIMKDLEKQYVVYKPQVERAVAAGVKQAKKEAPRVKSWIRAGAKELLKMTGEKVPSKSKTKTKKK